MPGLMADHKIDRALASEPVAPRRFASTAAISKDDRRNRHAPQMTAGILATHLQPLSPMDGRVPGWKACVKKTFAPAGEKRVCPTTALRFHQMILAGIQRHINKKNYTKIRNYPRYFCKSVPCRYSPLALNPRLRGDCQDTHHGLPPVTGISLALETPRATAPAGVNGISRCEYVWYI